MNALLVEDGDNVVVATAPVHCGDFIQYARHDGTACSCVALDDIPIYHKAAIRNIGAGEPVIKYGETICLAKGDIPEGSHVHVHNVADLS